MSSKKSFTKELDDMNQLDVASHVTSCNQPIRVLYFCILKFVYDNSSGPASFSSLVTFLSLQEAGFEPTRFIR